MLSPVAFAMTACPATRFIRRRSAAPQPGRPHRGPGRALESCPGGGYGERGARSRPIHRGAAEATAALAAAQLAGVPDDFGVRTPCEAAGEGTHGTRSGLARELVGRLGDQPARPPGGAPIAVPAQNKENGERPLLLLLLRRSRSRLRRLRMRDCKALRRDVSHSSRVTGSSLRCARASRATR
jgi:hypothetical protein